jgi:hypothetical protein
MSAPHTYPTDRFCVVVSGAWWVNSGADFDLGNCVRLPAASCTAWLEVRITTE